MLFDQKPNIDTGGTSVSIPTNYESKVTAPRNPTLNRGPKLEPKVCLTTDLKTKNSLYYFIIVHTFNIFKRNVIRYSTEIIEYKRNVSSENHRSIGYV
jgi:hypothetical protein